MTHHFKDKIAIVTGGASGIGRALAEELVQGGAVVHVADLDEEGARQVTERLGKRARPVRLDVTRPDDVEHLVSDVVSREGRLDLMINNAGIGLLGEVRDLSLDHWRRVLAVNLWGVIHGTMSAYRVMLDQGSGHIVNMASLGGLASLPATTAYSATKFGVVGLTLGLRSEAAGLGVKASVVCPGRVRTPILTKSLAVKVDTEKFFDRVEGKIKESEPDHVARVILRGVERNRGIIVTDFPSRLLWWLYRLNPALIDPLGRAILRDLRACRSADS